MLFVALTHINVCSRDAYVAFVTAVIALAHAAEMTVVVEGVETQAQLDIAVSAGADMAQGFRFAQPLTLEAAMRRVTNSVP